MTEKNTTQKQLRAVKPFEPDWPGPFCTRDGKPVRIVSREGRGQFSILGYIGAAEGIICWTAKGCYAPAEEEYRLDLMCAEEVVDLPERWVVYRRLGASQVLVRSSHTDRESAERVLTAARRASKVVGESFHLYHASPVVLPGEDA